MNITAIIPARGGSKGIPHKNLLPLTGTPLVVHSIQSATASEHINQIIVTTDDPAIAQTAQTAGARIIQRPPELSSDTASSESALLHALEQLEEQPDIIVFLQCTSPLTTPEDIDRCISNLLENNADSAFSATPSHRFLWKHPQQATGINHDPAHRQRRQDLEPEYAENGAIYVMRTEGFKQHQHRFFGTTVLSEMPAIRSWEIDTPEDITIIESLLSAQSQTNTTHLSTLPTSIQAVVFDFDGVFTDNGVYLSQEGLETVRCDRGDGWGIGNLHKAGIRMAVMSSEINPVVAKRCEKLKLECFHKLESSKYECFQNWCQQHQIDPQNVIFIGNDENDIGCLKAAGCGVVPADTHASTLPHADLILTRNGGHGAVRELCDLILEKQHHA